MTGREVWDLTFLSSRGVFGGFLPAREWIWVVTAFTFQPFSCQSPLPSITDTFWKTASPGHFQQIHLSWVVSGPSGEGAGPAVCTPASYPRPQAGPCRAILQKVHPGSFCAGFISPFIS